jgi:hypothetical protein
VELIPGGLDNLLSYFEFSHLPPHLQSVSKEFHTIAHLMVNRLTDSDEFRTGLRKLLEAKDCMVRAAMLNDTPKTPMMRVEVRADQTPDEIGRAVAEQVEKYRKSSYGMPG